MKIIQVENLKKNYGEIQAVKGISFSVEEGRLFAFLGENGAGKSTTILTLATLLKKTSGTINIAGYNMDNAPNEIRKSIGMVFQDHYLDSFLTVYENLIARGKMYNIKKANLINTIENLAITLEANDILNKKYSTLSGGQKRKSDIMRALVHNPKILILDEPTTGLDPSTRQKVWETILRLKEEKQLTIFLTTHYMEEAKKADYMVIMDKGIIKAEGKPEDLRLAFSKDCLIISPKDKSTYCQLLNSKNQKYYCEGHLINIPLNHSLDALKILEDTKNYINYFEVFRGSMDDVFINVIRGGDLNDFCTN